MSRIYWDSMVFVYWWEDHPAFAPRIGDVLTKMDAHGDTLCTSVFTIGEVLTGALKSKDASLVAKIKQRFQNPAIELLAFREETAERFAAIRATYHVTAPDAIHLATAAEARADIFLTNDSALIGKVVPGIGIITGMDANLF